MRDAARAYVAATGAPPGAYNVCSGQAVSVRELVELAAAVARVPVRHVVRSDRMRSHDVPEVRGSAARLSGETGWQPSIPLAQTVADAIEALRAQERVAP